MHAPLSLGRRVDARCGRTCTPTQPATFSGSQQMSDKALKDHQSRDVETLANLFAAQDPRSLEEIIAEDTETEDHVIEGVTVSDGRGCQLEFDGGWCGFFTFPEDEDFPEVGDTLRIYGSFGRPRHGFAINGKVIQYETPFEQFAS